MGQKVSLPEDVYNAVDSADLDRLQSLIEQARRHAQTAQQPVSAALKWQDIQGRTALHLAAVRNLMRHAELLLQSGADVHQNTSSRASGGTPLHEAVHAKHEVMVDLLLRHGANPFVENLAGKTPYDLAVDAGNLPLIRKLERCSIYAAYISFRVPTLKGFMTEAKDRWCVVMPRYLPQQPGQPHITVRIMLWLYKDAASPEPRTKVWLDGAKVIMSSVAAREASLRLHPNHEQPKNVAFKPGPEGCTLQFSPAAGGGDRAAALQQFQHFVNACASPLAPVPSRAGVAAGPTGGSTTSAGAAAGPTGGSVTSSGAAAGPTGGSVAAGRPTGGSGAYPAIPAVGGPTSSSSSMTAPAPGPGLWRPAGGVSAAAAPPTPGSSAAAAAAVAPSPWGSANLAAAAAAAGGGNGGALAALPGESDADFARRLALQLALEDAGIPPHRSSHSSGTAGAGRPPRTSHSSSAATTPVHPRPSSGSGSGSGNPFLVADPSPVPPVVQQPRPNSSAPTAPPAPASMLAAAAPTGLSPAAAGVTGGGSDAGDEGLCVICMDQPRQVGLLHGSSVHKCVCKECAGLVTVGSNCPLCRQQVERIIGVF